MKDRPFDLHDASFNLQSSGLPIGGGRDAQGKVHQKSSESQSNTASYGALWDYLEITCGVGMWSKSAVGMFMGSKMLLYLS